MNKVVENQSAELAVCCPACGWTIQLKVLLNQFVPRGLFKPSDKIAEQFLKGRRKAEKRQK